MKIVLQMLFILLLTALVGCSDSGSDSTGASSGSGLDSEVTVEGVVVNSILSGQICYDRNENKVCDVDEPFSPIDSNGGFALIGKMSDSTSSHIIAEINTATGNKQARNTGSAIILTTPLGKTLISPITTLVKAKIDEDPLVLAETAYQELKKELGIADNVDIFDINQNETVSVISKKVFSVISLMVTTLKDMGIEFSSGLMSMIYSEVNAQLPNIMDKDEADFVQNYTPDKKEEIESSIDNVNNKPTNIFTGIEMATQGMSMYTFNDHPESGYNFCLWTLDINEINVYCNGGVKDENGKIKLPTVEDHSDISSFPIFKNGDTVVFYIDNQRMVFNSFIKVDVVGKQLLAPAEYNNQGITFTSPGAMVYKSVNGYTERSPFANVENGEMYMFNVEAANDIRNQWDESDQKDNAENFFRTSKSLYTLDFDSNDDSYNVDFFEIGTTQAKSKRITFDESKNTGTLPGAVNAETYTVKANNGSLDININGEIQTIKSVSSKPISSVTSTSNFGSQKIDLPKGAVIYTLLFEQTQEIDPDSIEYLRDHMTGNPEKDDEWFNGSCNSGGYERQGDTILPTNPNWDCGTIKLNPANNTFTYRYTDNPYNVFPADTPLTTEKTGTYTENNVGYTFTANDGSVFYHFDSWLITYHTKENMAYAYFNDIAMKDIVKNWDATVLP